MPCIELGCVIQSTRKKLSLVLLFRFETQICSQGSHKLCECRSDHSGTVTSIYPCALKVLDCMSVITNCSTEFKMSFKRSEVHLLEISPSFAWWFFSIFTSEGKSVEAAPSYQHLAFFLFNVQFNNLVRKLKGEFVLYCRNKSCFTFNAKRKLEGASFSPDISFLLRSLDSVRGRHRSPSLRFHSSLGWKVKIGRGSTPSFNDLVTYCSQVLFSHYSDVHWTRESRHKVRSDWPWQPLIRCIMNLYTSLQMQKPLLNIASFLWFGDLTAQRQ